MGIVAAALPAGRVARRELCGVRAGAAAGMPVCGGRLGALGVRCVKQFWQA
jgi:hypothetical protein